MGEIDREIIQNLTNEKLYGIISNKFGDDLGKAFRMMIELKETKFIGNIQINYFQGTLCTMSKDEKFKL